MQSNKIVCFFSFKLMINLKRLVHFLLLLFRVKCLLWFGQASFFTYTIRLFSKETKIIKITFKVLHARHWNEMFKRRKNLGYRGHNSSQDHLHHKMWFITHYICLVLQLMDTLQDPRMLLFMVCNELNSEAHCQSWVSQRDENPPDSDT